MAKDFAVGFYKSKQWQRCREGYIASVHGLCEDCLKKGVYNPGVIVHHIEHITQANINKPEVTLNFNNLKLVCRDCHAKEHSKEVNKRYEIDLNGNVKINCD